MDQLMDDSSGVYFGIWPGIGIPSWIPVCKSHELCSLSSGMLADMTDYPPVLLALFCSCATA